jgi:glucosyl-dolichyl phosphate glucuronosyltransferase
MTNSSAPHTRLSIVICTYNRCASLAETLASVNACDMPAYEVELILVDNNSTDETARVCDEFARVAKMSFRRVIETAQGLSFARNRGIREARGDVIIFTDDDILVNSAWLTTYGVEFDERNADCAFGRVHPDWRGVAPDWFSNALRPAYALLDYGDERIEVSNRSNEFFGANFAVRKSILEAIGGFDVKLGRTKGKLFIGEETRVFLALMRRGSRVVYNPDILVHHVIEERRKEKTYLLKWYHDTAESVVYAALTSSNGRRFLGLPLYQLKVIAAFYAMLLPRWTVRLLRRDAPGLFALRLERRRTSRMLFLYAREFAQGRLRPAHVPMT